MPLSRIELRKPAASPTISAPSAWQRGRERLGAVAHHLPAGEQPRHQRVALEALKRHVRIEERIPVVEPRHEADREAPLRKRVDEPAPELLMAERVPHGMDDRAGREPIRIDVPQLLDADRVALRRATGIEAQPANQRLGEVAAHPVGQHRDPGPDVDTRLERGLAFPVPIDSAIAGAHPHDPVSLVEQLRPRESREHVDTRRLDLLGEPLRKPVEGDHVVTVVAQGRRRDGKRQGAARSQEVDAVVANRYVERRAAALPVRHQLREGRRVEHRPGEHVGAGRARLLQHRYHQRLAALLGVQPRETVRRGQSRRPAPDDEDVDIERLALHVILRRGPSR